VAQAHTRAGQTVATVLAAGEGRRFGGAKLSAPLAGKPLLLWPVEAALEAGLDRVLVVLGFHAERVQPLLPQHPRLEVLLNPCPAAGMGSSLALAAARAQELGAGVLVVLLGDMPLVDARLVREVAQAAATAPAGAAAAFAGTRRGHPVAFAARHLPHLARLRGDQGARRLVERLGDGLVRVPASAHSLWDVDHPQDLERAGHLLDPGDGTPVA